MFVGTVVTGAATFEPELARFVGGAPTRGSARFGSSLGSVTAHASTFRLASALGRLGSSAGAWLGRSGRISRQAVMHLPNTCLLPLARQTALHGVKEELVTAVTTTANIEAIVMTNVLSDIGVGVNCVVINFLKRKIVNLVF